MCQGGVERTKAMRKLPKCRANWVWDGTATVEREPGGRLSSAQCLMMPLELTWPSCHPCTDAIQTGAPVAWV
eukprot:365783-Chlamydomonas_euryale.AAC.5